MARNTGLLSTFKSGDRELAMTLRMANPGLKRMGEVKKAPKTRFLRRLVVGNRWSPDMPWSFDEGSLW